MQVRRPPLLVPGATVHRAGGQGGQDGLVGGADVDGKDLHWSVARGGGVRVVPEWQDRGRS